MKNLITVLALALVFALGTNSSVAQDLAQNANRPEVIAKTKTAELSETLQLNGDQQRSVFRALVAKEVGYKKNIDGKNQSDPQVMSDKKKFDDALTDSMKKTLTPDQFQKWKTLPNQ